MDRIVFLFSGQGAQYSGMGSRLYETSAVARHVFDTLERSFPDLKRLCFSGSEEELRRTENTQPCMYAVESAIAEDLLDRGIAPDALAGFSLGEIAALACSRAVDIDSGFRLVKERARLMQRDGNRIQAAMTAVLKLDGPTVTELADEAGVYPVNFNAPGQIVVSGVSDRIARFEEQVKNRGGRALRLNVSGAFHSPYMKTAAADFRTFLDQVEFSPFRVPLYSDVTGTPYEGDPRNLLAKQIASPVHFETIIRNLIGAGVGTFIEIGPGAVLTGLVKKIDEDVRAYPTDTPENIERIAQEVRHAH